ncbi:MAG TPA: hypothetical protein VF401_00595 [Candidatus Saccharimonadales bacterium]
MTSPEVDDQPIDLYVFAQDSADQAVQGMVKMLPGPDQIDTALAGIAERANQFPESVRDNYTQLAIRYTALEWLEHPEANGNLVTLIAKLPWDASLAAALTETGERLYQPPELCNL